MSGLLPLAEAQRQLLALGRPVGIEIVPAAEAAGRWLADDLRSLRTQPAADLSAMDGYAIRFGELPGPWKLIGESAAGAPLGDTLREGETARIFTGAPLPDGADTVLIQEHALREGEHLALAGDPPRSEGANVRRRGEDFAEGDTLAVSGTRITDRLLALAIAAGHGSLPVRRRIRIALISTGDELVEPGEITGMAEIPASNGPMLAAQLAFLPVDLQDRGIVPDRLDALGAAIEEALGADVIVTIGGASVGDRDLVRSALEEAGARLDFWKVAMKPGKPLLAGTLGEGMVLGLPGNPASAFVTAKLFLEPLIALLSGANDPFPRLRRARLGAPLPAAGSRHEFLRGSWRAGTVIPGATQSSGALAALAEAQLLISRPPAAPAAEAGESVEILDL